MSSLPPGAGVGPARRRSSSYRGTRPRYAAAGPNPARIGWLICWLLLEALLVGFLVASIVAPNKDDSDPGGATLGLVVLAALIGIICVQAASGVLLRRALPRRGLWRAPTPAGLVTDVDRRMADLEVALASALDGLGPAVDAEVRGTAALAGAKAAPALRDLARQTLAVDQTAGAALSPDRDRLAAAGRLLRRWLEDGLRDCAALVDAAAALSAGGSPADLVVAVDRVTSFVAELGAG